MKPLPTIGLVALSIERAGVGVVHRFFEEIANCVSTQGSGIDRREAQAKARNRIGYFCRYGVRFRCTSTMGNDRFQCARPRP